MKSVGEVMALGRNFPECLQKAIRMLSIGSEGVLDSPHPFVSKKELKESIKTPCPQRVFAIAEALFSDVMTAEDIYKLTKIDPWFITQVQRITDHAHVLQKRGITAETLKKAKILGFSDEEIARLTKKSFSDVRKARKQHKIQPVTKQIDTLAAEFPARTNYLYTTYLGEKNDV